jgi:hypothetical protein
MLPADTYPEAIADRLTTAAVETGKTHVYGSDLRHVLDELAPLGIDPWPSSHALPTPEVDNSNAMKLTRLHWAATSAGEGEVRPVHGPDVAYLLELYDALE